MAVRIARTSDRCQRCNLHPPLCTAARRCRNAYLPVIFNAASGKRAPLILICVISLSIFARSALSSSRSTAPSFSSSRWSLVVPGIGEIHGCCASSQANLQWLVGHGGRGAEGNRHPEQCEGEGGHQSAKARASLHGSLRDRLSGESTLRVMREEDRECICPMHGRYRCLSIVWRGVTRNWVFLAMPAKTGGRASKPGLQDQPLLILAI